MRLSSLGFGSVLHARVILVRGGVGVVPVLLIGDPAVVVAADARRLVLVVQVDAAVALEDLDREPVASVPRDVAVDGPGAGVVGFEGEDDEAA